MTKSASKKNGATELFQNWPDKSAMSEQELSEWAGKSGLLANEGYGVFGIGTAVFWSVVAVILIARFFLIDPVKLRPSSALTAPAAVSIFAATERNDHSKF